MLTKVRMVQTVMVGALVGWVFTQQERNMGGTRNRIGSIFMCGMTQLMFSMLGAVTSFPKERAVFLREVKDRVYHPLAFYLPKVIVDTAFQIFFPTVFGLITSYLMGLNKDTGINLLTYLLVLVLLSNTGSAIGVMISAGSSNMGVIMALLPGAMIPQLLLCGFLVDVDSLGPPFNYISYATFMRYSIQALILNEFACKSDKCFCCARDELIKPAPGYYICPMSGMGLQSKDVCQETVGVTSGEVDGNDARCCADADLVQQFVGADDYFPRDVWSNLLAVLVLMLVYRIAGFRVLCRSARK